MVDLDLPLFDQSFAEYVSIPKQRVICVPEVFLVSRSYLGHLVKVLQLLLHRFLDTTFDFAEI
jgi:hypothetical protein